MPKSISIMDYWVNELIDDYGKYWLDVYYDDDEIVSVKTSYCFACGSSCGTERAHIVPAHFDGEHIEENLHLLCKECHLESEWITDRDTYFNWFKSKNHKNSGSHLRLLNNVLMIIALFNENKLESIPPFLLDYLEKK